MSAQTETEIKLEIPAAAEAAVAAAVCTASARRTRLQAVYFDTADQRLAAARMALRLRREGARWVQTVKAAGVHDMSRLEHNVELGDDDEAPAVDPQRHAGTPVGELLLALLRSEGQAELPLHARYRTDIQRDHREVRRAGVVIELALDRGVIQSGDAIWPVCELELELLKGGPADLVHEARRWVERHGLWLDVRSKAERGERLARGKRRAGAAKAGRIELAPGMSPEAALRAVTAHCLQQIAPNAAEIASGVYSDEHVHQLRVGLRRLRTALRFFDGAGAGVDAGWAPALATLFSRLGVARDRAALAQAVAPLLLEAGAPVVSLPAGPEEAPPEQLLRQPAVTLLWLSLQAHAMSLPPDGAVGAVGAAGARAVALPRLCRKRLQRWHRQVLRGAAEYASLDEAARHRLRRQAKRLRYAVEFTAGLFKARRVRRFLAALARVQDALGAYNDTVTALPLYRAAAEQNPPAWFAVGWLTAHQTELSRRAGKALLRFAEVEAPWSGD